MIMQHTYNYGAVLPVLLVAVLLLPRRELGDVGGVAHLHQHLQIFLKKKLSRAGSRPAPPC